MLKQGTKTLGSVSRRDYVVLERKKTLHGIQFIRNIRKNMLTEFTGTSRKKLDGDTHTEIWEVLGVHLEEIHITHF